LQTLLTYFYASLQMVRCFDKRGNWRFTLAGVLLAASRGMQVSAFFLPIKALIVMASVNEPGHFNYFDSYISSNTLIAWLITLVPIAYLLYIAFGVAHRWVLDADMRQQKRYADDCATYPLKPATLAALHKRLAKAYADLILIVGLLLVMAIEHPLLALSLMMLVILNLMLFNRYTFDIKDDKRLTPFKIHRRQFVEYVASSNFLVVFFILALSVRTQNMGIFSAVLFLLLTRMLFQAVQRLAIESFELFPKFRRLRQQENINH
jgi:hypothetical protein